MNPNPNEPRTAQAASVLNATARARAAGHPDPAPHAERLARTLLDHADNLTAQQMWDEVVGTALAGGGSR